MRWAARVLVLLVLIGTVSIFAPDVAAIDTPYNGGFDGSSTGWTQPWTAGGTCEYDGTVGYGAVGSLKFGDPGSGSACAYDSLPVHATDSWTLRVLHRGSATSVCGLMIEVIAQNNPNQVTTVWTGGYTQANLWFQTDFQSMPAGDHYIRLRPSITGSCYVHIDDVQAIGTTGSNPAGTPTPGPTATPTRTATPGSTAIVPPGTVSAQSAQAAVALGTPVPWFDPSFYANPVIPVNLNGNTNPNVSVVEMSQRAMSFCLPDQISQVVAGVDLCISIPVVSVDALEFAGFDLMPYLTIAASVLFLAFIIGILRNR